MADLTLERDIEKYLTSQCKKSGLLTFKFTSPSNAGVPDRVILAPGGKIVFVELKKPGGRLRTLQAKRLERIASFGHATAVVDSKAGAFRLVKELVDAAQSDALDAIIAFQNPEEFDDES